MCSDKLTRTFTVAELIAELSKLPGELPVAMGTWDGNDGIHNKPEVVVAYNNGSDHLEWVVVYDTEFEPEEDEPLRQSIVLL